MTRIYPHRTRRRAGGPRLRRSAAQLTDDCPASASAYAGACIETAARPPATWPDAAEIRGDAGGRLAGLEELEGFRSEPGVTLAFSGEHTSSYLDVNYIDLAGENTVTIHDNGSLASGNDYGESFAASSRRPIAESCDGARNRPRAPLPLGPARVFLT